jgi:hypothetical protein
VFFVNTPRNQRMTRTTTMPTMVSPLGASYADRFAAEKAEW